MVNFGIKVNAIHLTFAKQLGFPIRPTNVGVQKINGTTLNTHGIVVAAFSVLDKANQVRFFEETFLVVNISPKVVFGMPFPTLSNVDVDYSSRELQWRTYTTKKALPTTRRVELVGRKEFAVAALNPKHETYIVYVGSVNSDASPSSSLLDVHPFQKSQKSSLIVKMAPTKVFTEDLDFANIFSLDLASELSEHSGINDHAIKLVNGYHQLPDGSFYSLGPVELETLKAYIETNLATRFIRLSKSPAGVPILFDRKSDGFF